MCLCIFLARFLLQAMFLSLQIFAFKGQNMKLTVKMLFTCILRFDAGPSCVQSRSQGPLSPSCLAPSSPGNEVALVAAGLVSARVLQIPEM